MEDEINKQNHLNIWFDPTNLSKCSSLKKYIVETIGFVLLILIIIHLK